MNRTCEYCGGLLDRSDATCPHCGAPVGQKPDSTPRTIEELRQYALEHPIN